MAAEANPLRLVEPSATNAAMGPAKGTLEPVTKADVIRWGKVWAPVGALVVVICSFTGSLIAKGIQTTQWVDQTNANFATINQRFDRDEAALRNVEAQSSAAVTLASRIDGKMDVLLARTR